MAPPEYCCSISRDWWRRCSRLKYFLTQFWRIMSFLWYWVKDEKNYGIFFHFQFSMTISMATIYPSFNCCLGVKKCWIHIEQVVILKGLALIRWLKNSADPIGELLTCFLCSHLYPACTIPLNDQQNQNKNEFEKRIYKSFPPLWFVKCLKLMRKWRSTKLVTKVFAIDKMMENLWQHKVLTGT